MKGTDPARLFSNGSFSPPSDARIFIDTNVLVYAHDRSAGEKHRLAKQAIDELWRTGAGLLSTQVLQEFFVTVTRKIPMPVAEIDAAEVVRLLLDWEHAVVDGEMILHAAELGNECDYHFWDRLILSAAVSLEADFLITEDMSHGDRVGGVTIVDPFMQGP